MSPIGDSTKINTPWLKPPYSIFSDVGGMLLANLDSMINFTDCRDSYLIPRSNKRIDYRIYNASLGMIQYFQYRSMTSRGEVIIDEVPQSFSLDDRIILRSTSDQFKCSRLTLYMMPSDGKFTIAHAYRMVELTLVSGISVIQLPLDCLEYASVLYDMCSQFRFLLAARPICLTDDTFFLVCHTKFEEANEFSTYQDGVRELMMQSIPIVNDSFRSWLSEVTSQIKLLSNYTPHWNQSMCCAVWNIPSRETSTSE